LRSDHTSVARRLTSLAAFPISLFFADSFFMSEAGAAGMLGAVLEAWISTGGAGGGGGGVRSGRFGREPSVVAKFGGEPVPNAGKDAGLPGREAGPEDGVEGDPLGVETIEGMECPLAGGRWGIAGNVGTVDVEAGVPVGVPMPWDPVDGVKDVAGVPILEPADLLGV
jgi:hypothetical protein